MKYLHRRLTKSQIICYSMAEARCRYTVSRLEWLDETVEINSQAVRQAREELLDGTLRNNRGTVSGQIIWIVLVIGLERIPSFFV